MEVNVQSFIHWVRENPGERLVALMYLFPDLPLRDAVKVAHMDRALIPRGDGTNHFELIDTEVTELGQLL